MTAENTALFIIDMQNDFVLPEYPCCIAGAERTIPKIADVLKRFRDKDLSIFHIVREYREDGADIEKFRYKEFIEGKKCAVPNTSGCEIVKQLQPLEREFIVVKNRFSGFMHTELDLILRRLQVTKIFITGTQYPNCIRATAFDAVSLGYDVSVVTDATSASTVEIAEANITDLKNIGIECINTSQLEL